MKRLDRYKNYKMTIDVLIKHDTTGKFKAIFDHYKRDYTTGIRILYEELTRLEKNADTYDDMCYYKCYREKIEVLL